MTDESAEERGDTGPFCRHWDAPGMCDLTCARCGHPCTAHEIKGNDEVRDFNDGTFAPLGGACGEDDCACDNWVEPEVS